MLLMGSGVPLLQAQVNVGTVSTDVLPNSTAFSSQRKVVRDSNGDIFVVYLKPVQNTSQVFLSESEDAGATWQDTGQVSKGNYQSVRATMAIDPANRVYVFWTKFIGEYGQIFYRTYDKAGWSDEYQLTLGEAYSGYPSACFDSKGRINLVWYGFDGTAYQIFFASYDGNSWSSPVKLSHGYPDSVNPTVAVDSSNNLHVAWFKSNGRNYQINYIRWSGAWNKQIVLSPPLTDAYNPSMAIDSRGRIYIVWDEGKGPLTRIHYSVFDGSDWSEPVALTVGPSAQNPSVAVDAQGRAYVFYEKSDGQIYLRKYDQVWSSEQKLTSSGENTYPSVRWSFNNNPLNGANGRIDFVWSSKEAGLLSVKYAWLNTNEPQRVTSPVPASNANELVLVILTITGATVVFLTLFLPRKLPRSKNRKHQ